MKSVKAQVTVFVLAAAVLVIGTGILLFSEQEVNEQQGFSEVTTYEQLNQYLDVCIEQEIRFVIFDMGVKGGYSEGSGLDVNLLETGYTDFMNISKEYEIYFNATPLYYYRYENIAPDLDTVQSEFEESLKNVLSFCVESVQMPFELHYDEQGSGMAVKISRDSVDVSAHADLVARFGERDYSSFSYSYQIPSSFFYLFSLAYDLTATQEQHGHEMCITCMGELANAYKLGLEFHEFYDDTGNYVIYEISDFSEEELFYRFAHYFPYGGMV